MLQKSSIKKAYQQHWKSLQASSRKYMITHLRGHANEKNTEKIVTGNLVGCHAYKENFSKSECKYHNLLEKRWTVNIIPIADHAKSCLTGQCQTTR